MKLELHGSSHEPTVALEATDLRITGGTIWNHLEHGLIAVFGEGFWRRHGHRYSSISVSGDCCLFFGITRQPVFVTEPVGRFTIVGDSFQANGVEFARYSPRGDIWQAMMRPLSWSATRIISAAVASGFLDQPGISLLNPWDPKRRAPGRLSGG
jgi:hypothetical protein